MPCDVYTESKYFTTIAKMVEVVENNGADLVLMGITPTYPSEKFGYVVPKSDKSEEAVFNNEYLRVAHFTEKPNMKKARELLRTTSIPIRDVALAVGYSNISYFSRQFKRSQGMTPLEFRRKDGDGVGTVE